MKQKALKILSIVLIVFAVLIIYIENTITVCEVIYTDDIERTNEEITSSDDTQNYVLMAHQVVTDGTAYHVRDSTVNDTLKSRNGDIILRNWIDPAFLRINNQFALFAGTQYIVVFPRDASVEIRSMYGEDVICIKPNKTIMLTDDPEIMGSAHDGKFFVKDLSVKGHIRFYLGLLLPRMREST